MVLVWKPRLTYSELTASQFFIVCVLGRINNLNPFGMQETCFLILLTDN